MHPRHIAVGNALSPPFVRHFAGDLPAQRPLLHMRVLRRHGFGRLLEPGQILRCDRPVGIEVEIPHQDPLVIDIPDIERQCVAVQNEEMLDPRTARFAPFVGKHGRIGRFDIVFFIHIPDIFAQMPHMVLGADAQFPPPLEFAEEIAAPRGVFVIHSEHPLEPPRPGLEFDLRIPVKVVSRAAVRQLVVRPDHEHAQSGQHIQRQIDPRHPVFAGPEIPGDVQQRFLEEILHPDPDLPRHFRFRTDDPEAALDLVFGRDEIVRFRGHQPSFRRTVLVRRGGLPFFQLDRVDPDRALARGEEPEKQQRLFRFHLERRLIAGPFVGRPERPDRGIVVDVDPVMAARKEDRHPDSDLGIFPFPAPGVKTDRIDPRIGNHLDRTDIRDIIFPHVQLERIFAIPDDLLVQFERLPVPVFIVVGHSQEMPPFEPAFQRGVLQQVPVRIVRQDQFFRRHEIHSAADVLPLPVEPLPAVQNEFITVSRRLFESRKPDRELFQERTVGKSRYPEFRTLHLQRESPVRRLFAEDPFRLIRGAELFPGFRRQPDSFAPEIDRAPEPVILRQGENKTPRVKG